MNEGTQRQNCHRVIRVVCLYAHGLLLEAGADRIGTSASLAIMAEWQLERQSTS